MDITTNQLKHACQELPRAVFCMDGRIRPNQPDQRPFIGLAGSGVLWSDEEVGIFVQKLKDAGIDTSQVTVTWHDFCGACSVFKAKHPEDERTQNEIAIWGAERLASALGSKKPVLRVGWSDDCNIKASGDPHKHTEPAIVIDGTGKADIEALKLDTSFLLSHAYAPDPDWIQQECDIALNIAMGEHGPGKDYFNQSPMPIYVFANNNEQQNHYSQILKQVFEHHRDFVKPIYISL